MRSAKTPQTWRTLVCALGLSLLAACGGAATPVVVVPPAPVPPTDALAWLPADASLLGHVALGPFRGTRLWAVWTNLQSERPAFTSWVDLALIDEISIGGAALETDKPSFVAAVKGRFGEGLLAKLALTDQTPAEERGLLRIYRRPEALWVQVSPELLLMFSADRLESVVSRASAGPGAPVKAGVLYLSLAERVGFEQGDLAVLIDDPEGKGREKLEGNTTQLGLSIPDDVLRAGASLDMGPNVVLVAVAESSSAEGAAKIQSVAERSLSSLANNMFVAMFGLRSAVSSLTAENQGAHVFVRGSIPEADLNGLLSKLQSVLDVAVSQGVAPTAP